MSGNKRKDFRLKPPITPVENFIGVIDTPDIDLTFNNGILQADLTVTGVTQGSYINCNITVDSKGRIVAISNGSGGGSASWGSIGPGTGVASQTDLVAYLATNYYPLLSNPAGYITNAALIPYLTSIVAASTYVPLTRNITIQGVTQDLSANRIWTFPSLPLKGGMYIERSFVLNPRPLNVLYIPSVNKLYCTTNTTNTIVIINASTGLVTNTLNGASIGLSSCSSLWHIKLKSIPEIWVGGATSGTNTYGIINITSGIETLTSMGVNFFGTSAGRTDIIEASPTLAYISNQLSQRVRSINTTTYALSADLFNQGFQPFQMDVCLNNSSLFNNRAVIAQTNNITIFNTSTGALISTTAGVAVSHFCVKYSSSQDQFITTTNDGRIIIYKPSSTTALSVFKTILGYPSSGDIFVDDVNGFFFVYYSNSFQTLVQFDLATNEPLQVISIPMNQVVLVTASKMSGDTVAREIYITTFASGLGNFFKIKY